MNFYQYPTPELRHDNNPVNMDLVKTCYVSSPGGQSNEGQIVFVFVDDSNIIWLFDSISDAQSVYDRLFGLVGASWSGR